jgi:hypothetical protein
MGNQGNQMGVTEAVVSGTVTVQAGMCLGGSRGFRNGKSDG